MADSQLPFGMRAFCKTAWTEGLPLNRGCKQTFHGVPCATPLFSAERYQKESDDVRKESMCEMNGVSTSLGTKMLFTLTPEFSASRVVLGNIGASRP